MISRFIITLILLESASYVENYCEVATILFMYSTIKLYKMAYWQHGESQLGLLLIGELSVT